MFNDELISILAGNKTNFSKILLRDLLNCWSCMCIVGTVSLSCDFMSVCGHIYGGPSVLYKRY